MRKFVCAVMLLVFAGGTLVFATGTNDRTSDLVNQLNGGACLCEVHGNACVKRDSLPPFLSFFDLSRRRHDQELCQIDAARALGLMGEEARPAVPALIQALNIYHNIDTGDGILGLRSAIALALGQINDPSAITPLIAVLDSDDPAMLSSSASVPDGYRRSQKSSAGAVVEALGLFGEQAKAAAPSIIRTLKESGSNKTRLCQTAAALGKIRSLEAIPVLIGTLKDDPRSPYCVAEALGNFGPQAKDALPVLRAAAGQSDLFAQEVINQAIKAIDR